MNKYILRSVLFLSPFLLLLASFFILDPFALVHGGMKGFMVVQSQNDDFNTFRNFEQYNDSLQYNAFILGNSKALAILSPEWKKYIGQEHKVFKFAAPGESILNIRKKLEHASASGNKIEHAILILDGKVLKNTNNQNPEFTGPVYLKGPKSSYNGPLNYFGKGFYYFLYDGFFIQYFGNLLKKNERELQQKEPDWELIEQTMSREEFKNLAKSNEFFRWDTEQRIINDSAAWIANQPAIGLERNTILSTVSKEDLEHLKEIKKLFESHGTKYKVIFGPEYTCVSMDTIVIQEFKQIFGNNKVYDFTADNAFCSNPYLFYEPNHYRPIVGKQMLKQVYK